MFLNRKDIEKIAGILEKFPDVESFELEQVSNNGIGTYTHMTFEQKINGLRGSFNVEISGIEDW